MTIGKQHGSYEHLMVQMITAHREFQNMENRKDWKVKTNRLGADSKPIPYSKATRPAQLSEYIRGHYDDLAKTEMSTPDFCEFYMERYLTIDTNLRDYSGMRAGLLDHLADKYLAHKKKEACPEHLDDGMVPVKKIGFPEFVANRYPGLIGELTPQEAAIPATKRNYAMLTIGTAILGGAVVLGGIIHKDKTEALQKPASPHAEKRPQEAPSTPVIRSLDRTFEFPSERTRSR